MLYRVLYDIRYIKIILNIMKMVFEKKFGKSRVRYIVGSLYRGLTVPILKCLKTQRIPSEILTNLIKLS